MTTCAVATSTNKLIDCLQELQRVHAKERRDFQKQWGLSKDCSGNYSNLKVRLCFDLIDLLKYLKKWSIIHRLIDPGCYCFIKSFNDDLWFVVNPNFKLLCRNTDHVIWSFAPNPPKIPKCEGWRCKQKENFSFNDNWKLFASDTCVTYLNCKFGHFFCGDCLRKRKSHSVLHKYCTCMNVDIDDPLAIIFGDTNYYFDEKRIARTESLVGKYTRNNSDDISDSSDDTFQDNNEQIKEDPDTKRNECAVCWEKEPSHAFNKCGHKCVCGTCAATLDKCVLCRQPGTAIKIYD